MVSQKSVSDQLKRIGFNQHAWGRAEVRELPNIILPEEEIFECVNGTYEGGFALLVATDVRVLLIDKKPFNYLTVEDLRFDMINEIDYNHRALGAYVDISTGNRDLKFRSYNQPRLRRLIGHVQRCMAEAKRKQASHQEGQNQHLEQINQRLQAYLMAQYQHQQELQDRLREAQKGSVATPAPEPPQPSPELSDYLLAQGLLAEHRAKAAQSQTVQAPAPPLSSSQDVGAGLIVPTPVGPVAPAASAVTVSQPAVATAVQTPESKDDDLYAAGRREIFGNGDDRNGSGGQGGHGATVQGYHLHLPHVPHGVPHVPHLSFDMNPLKIAYAKLPMALRNRKFGRPSLHAHSLAHLAELRESEALPQAQPT